MNNQAKSSFWKIILIILIIIIALIIFRNLAGLNKHRDTTTPPANPPMGSQFGISYGSDKLQTFDFYAPAGKQTSDTLIVVVHGGAWIGGDKNYMASVASYLAGQGYSVVNINYRLVPDASVFDQLRDIESVLNYVDARKGEFDLTNNYKTVLVGHSAGAHLSAFYGVDENKYGGKNIDYVVGLAGPYDLDIEVEGYLRQIVRSYVIGDYGVEAVSPIDNVEAGDATKFLLIWGEDDELVPDFQIADFENELKSKGVYVETLILPGRTHGSIMGQIPYGDVVARRILSFIEG